MTEEVVSSVEWGNKLYLWGEKDDMLWPEQLFQIQCFIRTFDLVIQLSHSATPAKGKPLYIDAWFAFQGQFSDWCFKTHFCLIPFPSAPSSCTGNLGRFSGGRTFQSPQHRWTCHFHRPDGHGWWWPGVRRDNEGLHTGLHLLPGPGYPQKWSCRKKLKEKDDPVKSCTNLISWR